MFYGNPLDRKLTLLSLSPSLYGLCLTLSLSVPSLCVCVSVGLLLELLVAREGGGEAEEAGGTGEAEEVKGVWDAGGAVGQSW